MKNYNEFKQALMCTQPSNVATQKLVDGVETLLDHYKCHEEFEKFLGKKYQEEAIILFYYEFLHKTLHKGQCEFAPVIGFDLDDAKEFHDNRTDIVNE